VSATATYTDLFKQASASAEAQMVKEAVGKLLLGAGLLGLGGVGGSLLGRHLEQKKLEDKLMKERALTFGAGALAGLAGPQVVNKLRGLGSSGLTGYGDYGDYYTPDQFGSI